MPRRWQFELDHAALADIDECANGPEAVCRRGRATLARIYAEETKTMRAVDALAYNDTKEATEEDAAGELLSVPWYARRLRHLIAFDGLKLPRVKDNL